MDQNRDKSFSGASSEALTQTFMQRVYQWMSAGLALTGFIAYWASGNVSLMRSLHGGAFIVLVLVELGIVFWLSSQAMRISATAATAGFLIYSALNGLTLSYIFIIYTSASIASTFFITAGTFAAVSLYGWTTKQDLTSLGGFFIMGLIGIIIASVVNMFMRSPLLYWAISYIGVGLFIGLTAYDTQKLKNIHQSNPGAPDQLAILGALSLYLDFINMFIFLLRIFGRRR
ncbi:MAG: Bax inhibitor-1/YccA family protein [Candidatus Omnitrophota bacterium]|nr:Bax inhibitor-1/YccA family protein [Candidatus Omnitrophota bacterium]